MSDWHRLLREAREAEGLSRRLLGAAAGVSPYTVKAYELGLKHPSRVALVALLDALRVDRLTRNTILAGAGFAPDGESLAPSNDDYALSLAEATAAIAACPWPAHVNNEFMEVLSANAIAQSIWGVDLEREFNSPVERNMLTVAATPRFADRILNWDEMVSIGVGIMKGHHRGGETLSDEASLYFAAVMQHLFDGDPRYLTRFLGLWEAVPPRVPKVRWYYPVTWDHLELGVLRFTVAVSTVNDVDGLYINDWIPRDVQTGVAIAGLLDTPSQNDQLALT